MNKSKQKIGTISGLMLMTTARHKLNRSDHSVKSGTGYHKSKKEYNRSSKSNKRLKNKLKDYGSEVVLFIY